MQKRWIALIMAAVMSVPIRLLSAGTPRVSCALWIVASGVMTTFLETAAPSRPALLSGSNESFYPHSPILW